MRDRPKKLEIKIGLDHESSASPRRVKIVDMQKREKKYPVIRDWSIFMGIRDREMSGGGW